MNIVIKNRFTDATIHEGEYKSLCAAVGNCAREGIYLADADLTGANLTHADLTRADLAGANLAGAYLTRADLTGAYLADADLTGANLTHADLTRANLAGADLTGADLTGANLTHADLTRANLAGANLAGAELTRADLTRADLTRADLTGADLTGVYLADADLTRARDGLRAVLDAAPYEVAGLLLSVREGRINGSQYEGSCVCLKGTIANLRGCSYQALGDAPALQPDSSSASELLFMAISPGHVPAINPVAKIIEGWILEWQTDRQSEVP